MRTSDNEGGMPAAVTAGREAMARDNTTATTWQCEAEGAAIPDLAEGGLPRATAAPGDCARDRWPEETVLSVQSKWLAAESW